MLIVRKNFYFQANIRRERSGSQATKVDLMVVMNGTGDFKTFLHNTKEAAVVVECRVNTTASRGC